MFFKTLAKLVIIYKFLTINRKINQKYKNIFNFHHRNGRVLILIFFELFLLSLYQYTLEIYKLAKIKQEK